MTVYVEDSFGIYSAYASSADPYICGKIVKCDLPESTASALIQITKEYNEAQSLMREVFKGGE